jgi:hypothetical protein
VEAEQKKFKRIITVRKRILTVLAFLMAFGWTCLSTANAETKAAGNKTVVSDSNEKTGKTHKQEKKEKKEKKHEGKKHEKKVEDQNSMGKKS